MQPLWAPANPNAVENVILSSRIARELRHELANAAAEPPLQDLTMPLASPRCSLRSTVPAASSTLEMSRAEATPPLSARRRGYAANGQVHPHTKAQFTFGFAPRSWQTTHKEEHGSPRLAAGARPAGCPAIPQASTLWKPHEPPLHAFNGRSRLYGAEWPEPRNDGTEPRRLRWLHEQNHSLEHQQAQRPEEHPFLTAAGGRVTLPPSPRSRFGEGPSAALGFGARSGQTGVHSHFGHIHDLR